MGFAVLSGAGLLKGKDEDVVHVHTTSLAYSDDGTIDLTDSLGVNEVICPTAPIFVVVAEEDGSVTGELIENLEVSKDGKQLVGDIKAGQTLFVDFYVQKASKAVDEIQIDAENFAGYYYVEASTLFRRQNDGVDMPAEITIPNVKIQSNFTFSMASSGDPSSFSFTMDAFPGYTYFNPTRKVLCAIQVVTDTIAGSKHIETVFPHDDREEITESKYNETEDGVKVPGDSVDEDSIPLAPISEDILTVPHGVTWLGEDIDKMISEDAYVCENGTVHGDLKYVKDFVGFNALKPEEQEGYYFPVVLADGIGEFGDTMILKKNGVETKSDMKYDPEILLRVPKSNTIWEILVKKAGETKAKSIVKLNFRTANFEKK